jgi:hypothetical protein
MCVSFHINNPYIGDNIGLSMKILLTIIICSQVANTCLDPYPWPETFRNQYDCLTFGYEESLKKMKEMGREEVNKYNVYIKFYCSPTNTV